MGPGRPLGSYKINEDKLKSYIIENPDALSDEMYIEFGVTIAAISAALKRLNFTRKKSLHITLKDVKKNDNHIQIKFRY